MTIDAQSESQSQTARAAAGPPQGRFVDCPVCGPTVDREHMGQMFHHFGGDGQHEPLED